MSTGKASRILALFFTVSAGLGLLAATPVLLFVGGWAGADAGEGIYWPFVHIPWVIYLVCAGSVWILLRHQRNYVACIFALLPASLAVWLVYRIFFHR